MQLPPREACAMSGKRYLFDTNAIIALLQGNNQLLQHLQGAEWIGISVINQIEFLAFPGLNDEDRLLFSQFLRRIDVVGLMPEQIELIDLVIKLRQQYRIKLPDAIIAATAIQFKASLVTADNQLQNVEELDVVNYIFIQD